MHEPEAEHQARDDPMPIAGTATREIRRSSSAISLGRSACQARTFRIPAAAPPPRKRNAPVTWSISSQS